jgi:hypothetical protein
LLLAKERSGGVRAEMLGVMGLLMLHFVQLQSDIRNFYFWLWN